VGLKKFDKLCFEFLHSSKQYKNPWFIDEAFADFVL
jgi:hypothetical protein